MLVAGVDGCKAGWVAIVLDEGGFVRATLERRFDALQALLGECSWIAVDIPVGLVDRGTRRADVEARRRLGSRASTLFVTPPREALQAPTYAEANRLARGLSGSGVSRQAYALRERILEVEAVAGRDQRVVEVHPELSFLELARWINAPTGALPPKKTWSGLAARRRLLEAAGIVVPEDVGRAGIAGADDILDAAAAAWTARRVASGSAYSLPADPELSGTSHIAIRV